MSQPTQHSLIHVLLLWTTILSIIQVVFIILFFTVGHHGQYQNSSTVAPERTMQVQENNTTLSPPEHTLLLGKGQMLTFKATQVNNEIKWIAKNPESTALVSEDREGLTIKKDGYYFLNLQVTLKTCTYLCNETGGSEPTVSLKWNGKNILQGWINTNTRTGLIGKVEELSAGGTLKITFNPPTLNIDETETLTHLNIIYMLKP